MGPDTRIAYFRHEDRLKNDTIILGGEGFDKSSITPAMYANWHHHFVEIKLKQRVKDLPSVLNEPEEIRRQNMARLEYHITEALSFADGAQRLPKTYKPKYADAIMKLVPSRVYKAGDRSDADDHAYLSTIASQAALDALTNNLRITGTELEDALKGMDRMLNGCGSWQVYFGKLLEQLNQDQKSALEAIPSIEGLADIGLSSRNTINQTVAKVQVVRRSLCSMDP
jgi:hypothetical protein